MLERETDQRMSEEVTEEVAEETRALVLEWQRMNSEMQQLLENGRRLSKFRDDTGTMKTVSDGLFGAAMGGTGVGLLSLLPFTAWLFAILAIYVAWWIVLRKWRKLNDKFRKDTGQW